MAVYKRTYRGHEGEATPAWSRFLIPARYNFRKVIQIRFLVLFMTVSLFYPMGCAVIVYLSANADVVQSLGLQPFAIDGQFFYTFCRTQGMLAFLLTAFVSPSLVSWDISNGALQLYFCRPFSRLEYVLAKLAVIFPMLSILTWVPAMMLFVMKVSISDWQWTVDNWWLGRSVFIALFIWSLLLSLLGLALSASVKQRVLAGGLILGIYFGGAGLAGAINLVMGIDSGALIDITQDMQVIWADLLRFDNGSEIVVSNAWFVIGIVTAFCIWILNRRIRSFEVIK